MSEELRKRARVDYDIRARIQINDVWSECRLVNISMSGALLEIETSVVIGEKGNVHMLHTCGIERIEVVAEFVVVRVQGEMGKENVAIVFEHLDSDSSINLFNIIKYQSSK